MAEHWMKSKEDLANYIEDTSKRFRAKNPGEAVLLGSCCTGLATDLIICDAASVQTGLHLNIAFMCEQNQQKANRLVAITDGIPIFKNMFDLHTGMAAEWRTGKQAVVPKVDLKTS